MAAPVLSLADFAAVGLDVEGRDVAGLDAGFAAFRFACRFAASGVEPDGWDVGFDPVSLDGLVTVPLGVLAALRPEGIRDPFRLRDVPGCGRRRRRCR